MEKETRRQTSTDTEPQSAVNVDSTPRITLFITYLLILLLFAAREFREATRIASQLPQDDDQLVGAIVQAVISDGYLHPDWLDSSHPRSRSGDRYFGPGGHRGINPTARGPTWGCEFATVRRGIELT